MTQPNPFQAPSSDLAAGPAEPASLIELARAQKLLIYAILISFAAIVFRGAGGLLMGLLGLVSSVLSIMGIFGMAAALRLSTLSKVLLAISMLIPLVSLVVLFVLNAKATKVLRAGGYKVGLLGASKR